MPTAPAPLFRDPTRDGAADPTIIRNRQENAWWMLYTSRRANEDCPGVAWAHGTDIGVASSTDDGLTWRYRGVLPGLEFEPGRNTFWAPEVLWHDDRYHMYVTYVQGVPHNWSGTRRIIHYTSADLWAWSLESPLALSSDRVIDACVHPLPGGTWRMWYKDEAHGSHTYAADSADLYHWQVAGAAITDCPHEGPNVFQWQGEFWMITDPWNGLGVYRSHDLAQWSRQDNILTAPGSRTDDTGIGRHADVLVAEDRAYILYFVHPEAPPRASEPVAAGITPYAQRRSVIQIAELHAVDGVLTCDRDRAFDLCLGTHDNWG